MTVLVVLTDFGYRVTLNSPACEFVRINKSKKSRKIGELEVVLVDHHHIDPVARLWYSKRVGFLIRSLFHEQAYDGCVGVSRFAQK